jgi:hypothetical protein
MAVCYSFHSSPSLVPILSHVSQSTSSHPVSSRFFLILSFHQLLVVLLFRGFAVRWATTWCLHSRTNKYTLAVVTVRTAGCLFVLYMRPSILAPGICCVEYLLYCTYCIVLVLLCYIVTHFFFCISAVRILSVVQTRELPCWGGILAEIFGIWNQRFTRLTAGRTPLLLKICSRTHVRNRCSR